jgi:hypothetical protein
MGVGVQRFEKAVVKAAPGNLWPLQSMCASPALRLLCCCPRAGRHTRVPLLLLLTGSCTRMPCTSGLAFSCCTTSSTSCCVAVSGRSAPKDAMPTSSQALRFMRTYVCESLRSPTITTAKPGTWWWWMER